MRTPLERQPPTPVPSNQAVEFLRVVQQHHMQLSSMADFKANVLFGASFLIFGAGVKEFRDGHASVALFLMMSTAFTAAALIVLAMLPTTSRANGAEPNLLFFGVFARMPEAEFQSRMEDLLDDEHKLHRAMIRDIHQLGCVLRVKKYRRLGQAYLVFFYGLMAAGAALLVETAWRFLRF